MRKKFLIIGMITATACTAVSGCAEKKEGPQTIISELADPADIEAVSYTHLDVYKRQVIKKTG